MPTNVLKSRIILLFPIDFEIIHATYQGGLNNISGIA